MCYVIASLLLSSAMPARVLAQYCPEQICVHVKKIYELAPVGQPKSTDKARILKKGNVRVGEQLYDDDTIELDRGVKVVLKAQGKSNGEITLPELSSHLLKLTGECGVASIAGAATNPTGYIGKWTDGGAWGVRFGSRTWWCMLVYGTEVILEPQPDGSAIVLVDGCVEILKIDSTGSDNMVRRNVDVNCGQAPKLTQADSLRIDRLVAYSTLPVSRVSKVALRVDDSGIQTLKDRVKFAALAQSMFYANHVLGKNFLQRQVDWYSRQGTLTQAGLGAGIAAAIGGGVWFVVNSLTPKNKSIVDVTISLPN